LEITAGANACTATQTICEYFFENKKFLKDVSPKRGHRDAIDQKKVIKRAPVRKSSIEQTVFVKNHLARVINRQSSMTKKTYQDKAEASRKTRHKS
jgi:hypothetical protein